MAASLWRMNGVWRRMAGVLVLCALLLSNEVMCQDEAIPTAPAAEAGDAADASVVTDAAGTAAAPDVTAAPDVGADPTAAAGGESATSAVPDDSLLPFTIRNIDINADNQDGGASGTITVTDDKPDKGVSDVPAEVPDNSPNVKVVVPEVTCVGQADFSGKQYVEVEVKTADCEESKRIIKDNPANWCETQNCRLSLHQNGNRLVVSSDDAHSSALAEVLQSNHMRDKLTKAPAPSSSGSSVFVGILVSGLLAAIAITVSYFKCQRRSDTKGVRLAEEGHPVDQENQGNTLVSVAPLNPPPETQEKPSVNGESPEAAKTLDPPPTNGHSTAKTADTEM